MGLSVEKWKKAFCFALFIMLAFIAWKGVSSHCISGKTAFAATGENSVYASQVSRKDDKISFGYANVLEITCSVKSIAWTGEAVVTVKPAGAEIYRANVKPNGKNGKFKKVGECKDIHLAEGYGYEDNVHWTFHYEDNTVKAGNAYAYKYRVYCRTGKGSYQYREGYSRIKRGVAAKTVGEYSCRLVKSTAKKLIVKLTGTHKKNGPLEPFLRYHDTELQYVNNRGEKIHRKLELIKYSYDGKKWYQYEQYKKSFTIKGKQCVYLHFIEYIDRSSVYTVHNIKVSGCQHVQMFFWPVSYNLSDKFGYEVHLGFDLDAGIAALGDFAVGIDADERPIFKWDKDLSTEAGIL